MTLGLSGSPGTDTVHVGKSTYGGFPHERDLLFARPGASRLSMPGQLDSLSPVSFAGEIDNPSSAGKAAELYVSEPSSTCVVRNLLVSRVALTFTPAVGWRSAQLVFTNFRVTSIGKSPNK